MTKSNLNTKAFVLVYSFRGRRVHQGREGTAVVTAGTGRQGSFPPHTGNRTNWKWGKAVNLQAFPHKVLSPARLYP